MQSCNRLFFKILNFQNVLGNSLFQKTKNNKGKTILKKKETNSTSAGCWYINKKVLNKLFIYLSISGYHYCRTLFNRVKTLIMHRLRISVKNQCQESLTLVLSRIRVYHTFTSKPLTELYPI